MRLRVHNYRRAAGSSLSVEAGEDLVLVCGPNGSGKTTLADAVHLAVHRELPDGSPAGSAQKLVGLSQVGQPVQAGLSTGSLMWTFERMSNTSGGLQRGPAPNYSLTPRLAAQAILKGGVAARRTLGAMAVALAGSPDGADVERAVENSRACRRRLAEIKQQLAGARSVLGVDAAPSDAELAAADATVLDMIQRATAHQSWEGEVERARAELARPICSVPCATSPVWSPLSDPSALTDLKGACPHARTEARPRVDLAGLLAREPAQAPDRGAVEAARERRDKLRALHQAQSRLHPLTQAAARAQEALAEAEQAQLEAERTAALCATQLDSWWGRFPLRVALDSEGSVSIRVGSDEVSPLGLSGGAAQWLTFGLEALAVQMLPAEYRWLGVEADRLAVDQLARLLDVAGALHREGRLTGAVVATCHPPASVPAGWSVVRL